MLLAVGTFSEILKFLQVLCWIALPILSIAVGLTIFLHYRKKKRNGELSLSLSEEELSALSPGFNHRRSDGEYIFFDHSALIREYRNKLSYNYARYTALWHDFSALAGRNSSLPVAAPIPMNNTKNNHMLNLDELPQNMREEINLLMQEHAAEKKELLARMEQLNRSYRSLEQENQSLLDQLNAEVVSEGNVLVPPVQKEALAEHEYLQDVIAEKKAQIEFLQNQLEQRIKTHHQSDQQRIQAIGELENIKTSYAEALRGLETARNELNGKSDAIDQIEAKLVERNGQIEAKEQLLIAQSTRLAEVETELGRERSEAERLAKDLARSNSTITGLQQKLTDEQQRLQLTEEKLSVHHDAVRRLYADMGNLLEGGEGQQSPVIPLLPNYENREKEETAIVVH